MSPFRKMITVEDGRGGVAVVDVTTFYDYDPRPTYGCAEPRIHEGCGGTIEDYDGYFINCDGDEFSVDYKCEKCGETFMEPREWMFE